MNCRFPPFSGKNRDDTKLIVSFIIEIIVFQKKRYSEIFTQNFVILEKHSKMSVEKKRNYVIIAQNYINFSAVIQNISRSLARTQQLDSHLVHIKILNRPKLTTNSFH